MGEHMDNVREHIEFKGQRVWRRLSDGQIHRMGAPACISADGWYTWVVDGKCHRADGPAVYRVNAQGKVIAGTQQWWYEGVNMDMQHPYLKSKIQAKALEKHMPQVALERSEGQQKGQNAVEQQVQSKKRSRQL